MLLRARSVVLSRLLIPDHPGGISGLRYCQRQSYSHGEEISAFRPMRAFSKLRAFTAAFSSSFSPENDQQAWMSIEQVTT